MTSTCRAFLNARHVDHIVALVQLGWRVTPMLTRPHGADVALGEANAHALAGAHQDFVVSVGQRHVDQLVLLRQHDGNQAVLAQVLELGHRRFLDHAALWSP